MLRITEPTKPQTNAERQHTWRERHWGKPRGTPAMQAQLAVLQGHVAQLA